MVFGTCYLDGIFPRYHIIHKLHRSPFKVCTVGLQISMQAALLSSPLLLLFTSSLSSPPLPQYISSHLQISDLRFTLLCYVPCSDGLKMGYALLRPTRCMDDVQVLRGWYEICVTCVRVCECTKDASNGGQMIYGDERRAFIAGCLFVHSSVSQSRLSFFFLFVA